MADEKSNVTAIGTEPFLVPAQLRPLVDILKKMYLSKDLSDVTVVCKGHQWKVHRAVLAQSPFFEKEFTGEYKEATAKELPLDDEEPQVVDAMLHYLYNFDYGDHGFGQEHTAPIVLDVRMFAIADKRFIEPLKALAVRKFAKRAESEWATDDFATAIAEVYAIVPANADDLHKVVMRTVKKHAKELFDETKGYAKFREVVGDVPEIGADISKTLALSGRSDSEVARYTCPSCQVQFRFDAGNARINSLSFGCPNGCYTYNLNWWNQYKQN